VSLIPNTSRRLYAAELRSAPRRPLTRKQGAATAALSTIYQDQPAGLEANTPSKAGSMKEVTHEK